MATTSASNAAYQLPTLFIGGGNMAQALLGGLLARGTLIHHLSVVEIAPEQRAKLQMTYPALNVQTAITSAALATAKMVVLAVKPQQVREVAALLAPHLQDHGVLSIAAGVPTHKLCGWLGGYDQLVRAMPNLPALVGRGITALYRSSAVSLALGDAAEDLLKSVGETLWVAEEAQLDAVTAVSGSGPAYFYYWVAALEQAALDLGLPEEVARQLTQYTFAGAAALAENALLDGRVNWKTLQDQVTSKGGTTEAALQVLQQENIAARFAGAIHAAAKRAEELSRLDE